VSSPTIQTLHDSPWQGVLHVTGGGVSLLSELLGVAGASRTVLDATIPYANNALTQLLGRAPEQASSAATARALAMAAFQRASILGEAGSYFGLGCTASLVTDRKKRGQTRAHWAIQTATATYGFYQELDPQQPRSEQERLLRERLIESLGAALLNQTWSGATMDSWEADPVWHELLGTRPYRWCSGNHDGRLILPGSFNPVHNGHYEMVKVAQDICGKPCAFELTLRNADKPDLDYLSVRERLDAIEGCDVWLTNQANFVDKAELFPQATFVLGTDTMSRIGELRFYDESTQNRDKAIRRLQELGIRFLVLGRLEGQRFVSLDDLSLPPSLRTLCQGVPESVYRNDQSSTQLRQQNAQ
jgi:nicotinamide mononucleotide (NMN) deamidase PncC